MMNTFRKLTILFSLGFMAVLGYSQTTTKVVNGNKYIVHEVVSSETLYKLSKKYNVTVQAIKDANGGSESIKIGQELLIPAIASEETVQLPPTTETHVVKSGETLSKLAVKYETTVAALKELNNLSNTDIKIGQKLLVPASTTTGAVAELPAIEVDGSTQKAEDPMLPPEVVKPKTSLTTVQQPSNPRNIATDNESKITKGVVGGMPENSEVVLAETATEKEETAIAVVQDAGMDQTRAFIKHPTLSKGSIVVVINESTGKMAYCRVVENVKIADLDGASIVITKAVADKIGAKVSPSTVKIRYATP